MPDLQIISALTLTLGLGYFFTALYLLSQPQPQKSTPQYLPQVAVLIAMRNEAEYISDCLLSLERQNYPLHLFKVCLIDDGSTDFSAEIARPIIERNENFYFISITGSKFGLTGKMNALAQALQKIDAEIILITDADCQVPETWITCFIEYFDPETGMVGGLTLLEPPQSFRIINSNSTLFSRILALDWIFLQTIAAATCNAKLPVTILGNNLGFRYEAYKQIGTFRKLGFSVTEDYALLRAIDETNRWKIKYIFEPRNTIFSQPVKNLYAFYQQRKRWIHGGKHIRLWGYFLVGLSVAAHLSILLTILFRQWRIGAALGIGLIVGIDYFIIKRVLQKYNLNHLKKYFPLFEIFHVLYLIYFGITFPFLKKVKWKNRTF